MQDKNRVTIYDIAKKLGISASTVNRAINQKDCVNKNTREAILKTAEEMGYKANSVAMSLTRKKIKIGFMVNEKILEYQNKILEGARSACKELSDYNVEGQFYMISRENCRQKIIDKIYEIVDAGIDGIIFTPSSGLGFDEVLNSIWEKNIPIATVVTDVNNSERLFSVRPNGVVAGRIACELLRLIGLDEGDEVAIFTGSKETEIHKEYIDGFLEVNMENRFELISIIENHDDPRIAYLSTESFIKENPNIKGIYISSANSVTVCKRIVELGYAHKIKVIATDLFPDIVEYINTRVISATIFQDPFKQGEIAFKAMYEYIANKNKPEKNIMINPKIVLRTNINEYLA